jgi:hypothetical protein
LTSDATVDPTGPVIVNACSEEDPTTIKMQRPIFLNLKKGRVSLRTIDEGQLGPDDNSTVLGPPIVRLFAAAAFSAICAVPPLFTKAFTAFVGTPAVKLLDENQLPVAPIGPYQKSCAYKAVGPN